MRNVYQLRRALTSILAQLCNRLTDLRARRDPFRRAMLALADAQGAPRRALRGRWGAVVGALLGFMLVLGACMMVAGPPGTPDYLSLRGIDLIATPPAPLPWPSAILPPPMHWRATPTAAASPASLANAASAASPASPLATPARNGLLNGSVGGPPGPSQTLPVPVAATEVTPTVAALAAAPASPPTATPAPAETDPALARSLRATLQAARLRPFIPTPTPTAPPRPQVPISPLPSPTTAPIAILMALTPRVPSMTPAALTPVTSTNTVVPVPGTVITEHVSFIGDSIMLGAAAQIQTLGNVDVDARVSRQVGEVLQILHARAAAGTLGPIVVLHIGNNGTLTVQEFDEIMGLLAGQRQVIFLTIKVPRAWAGPNNAILAAGAARFPNVTLIDWAGLTAGRPGLFWADGMHLRPEGARFYTDLIVSNLKP